MSFKNGGAWKLISDQDAKLKNMYCQKPGKIIASSMLPFKVFINQ